MEFQDTVNIMLYLQILSILLILLGLLIFNTIRYLLEDILNMVAGSGRGGGGSNSWKGILAEAVKPYIGEMIKNFLSGDKKK